MQVPVTKKYTDKSSLKRFHFVFFCDCTVYTGRLDGTVRCKTCAGKENTAPAGERL